MLNKSEVKAIVGDEVKKYLSDSLDKDVKKLVHANSSTRGELVNLIKDSIESVFKTFWQKKEIWKSDIR